MPWALSTLGSGLGYPPWTGVRTCRYYKPTSHPSKILSVHRIQRLPGLPPLPIGPPTPRSWPGPLLTATDINTGCQENRPGMTRGGFVRQSQEEPSHANPYRLRNRGSPLPKVLPKHEPPLLQQAGSMPVPSSWTEGHALAVLPPSPALRKRQPSGAPSKGREALCSAGPGQPGRGPTLICSPHFSLQQSRSLPARPFSGVPLAPAPQGK